MPQARNVKTRDPKLLSSLSDDSDASNASDGSSSFPEDRYIRRERRAIGTQPRILSFNVKDSPEILVSENAARRNQKSTYLDSEKPLLARTRPPRRSRTRISESENSEDDSDSQPRTRARERILVTQAYSKEHDLFPSRSGAIGAFSTSSTRGAAIIETDVQSSAVYKRLLHQPITQNLATVKSYLMGKCKLDTLTITDVTKAEPIPDAEHTFKINFAWSERHQHVDPADTCQYRWIHGQGNKMNIEDIKILVTGLPQVDVEEKALAITLLDVKKMSFENNRSSGGYLQPSASRFDAIPTITKPESVKWAIFCNIPYISIAKSRTLKSAQPQFIQSQPITQVLYPLENIRPVSGDRRALCQVGHIAADSVVVVSHLWAVVTSSGVLVTLCPSSFTSLHEPYLLSDTITKQLDRDSKSSDRKVRMRCPTDEHFVFTFPFYTCASYFALSSVAHDAYSEYYGDQVENLIIRGKSEFEINERSWRTYCKQQEGSVVEVTVANNTPSKPPSRSSSVSSDDSLISVIETQEIQYQTRSQEIHTRERRTADQIGEAEPVRFLISTFADELEIPPFFLWPLEFHDEVYVIPSEIRERYKSSRRDGKKHSPFRAGDTLNNPTNDSVTKARKKELPAVDSVLKDVESKILRPLKKTDDDATKKSRNYKIALFYKASRTRRKPIETTFEEEFAAFTASGVTSDNEHSYSDSATWQQVLIKTVNLIQNALDAFCPADYSHSVLQTLQNILEHLFLDVKSICEDIRIQKPTGTANQIVDSDTDTSTNGRPKPPFEGRAIVFDQAKMTNLPVRWFEPTFVPTSGCERCKLDEKGAAIFDSWYQAIDHLRRYHTLSPADISDEALAGCIMSKPEFSKLDAAVQVTVLMFNVTLFMQEVMHAIQGIRYGASDVEGKLKNCLFTLPEELKEAYHSLTSMLVHFGYTASTIEQVGPLPDDVGDALQRVRQKNEKNIGPLLESTAKSIRTANSRLQHMNLPLDHSARQFYNCLGPPYLLAAAIRGLSDGTAENEVLQLLYAYEAYVQRISYKIKRHPQRRLRTEIVECQDELTAILHVFNQQLDTVKQLSTVLDDDNFSKPSKERKFQYKFEREVISSHQQDLRYRIKTCKQLLSEFQRMEAELVRALEIESDDQDKAILAFTIVTIIFLPLSFATSFLGMNTTDIRDMDSSQWLFWAIALPLTFVTVAATIMVAYRADYLRDSVSDGLHAVANKLSRDPALKRDKHQLEHSDEKDGDNVLEIIGDRQV